MTEQKIEIVARSFTDEEIQEINQYINANIPYSILQTIFPLSEVPLNKIKVYTIIYRILNAAKNVLRDESTKQKLIELLEENKETYEKLYTALLKYQNQQRHFGKHRMLNRMLDEISYYTNIAMINKLIDIFLVFAEKVKLLDLDRVSGLDIESDEGKKILSDIMKPDEEIQQEKTE